MLNFPKFEGNLKAIKILAYLRSSMFGLPPYVTDFVANALLLSLAAENQFLRLLPRDISESVTLFMYIQKINGAIKTEYFIAMGF